MFWKNLVAAEGELTVVSREQMKEADKLGLVSRHAPWEHYVEPLLKGAVLLREARSEVPLRVYLAADLEFLIEDLVAVGCEVFLMKSASIRHNPGAMWRFLALEAADEWVTVIDADRGRDIVSDVERSEQAMAAGLGMWRVPYFFDGHRHKYHVGFYRPINACQFGAKGGQPMELLIKAFIWHNRRGTMRTSWQEPGDRADEKPQPLATTTWPSYGFDEWFLLAAMYPRLGLRWRADVFPLASAGTGFLPHAGRGIRHLGESGQRDFPLSGAACGGGPAVEEKPDQAEAGGPGKCGGVPRNGVPR